MSLTPEVETVIKVEVYKFPKDCVLEELKEHFEERPYLASCRTADDVARDQKTSTFVLEFSEQEAERILAVPKQLLEEGDAESEIYVRRYTEPTRQVLLVNEGKELNARYLKKLLKKLDVGEVKECVSLGSDIKKFIVTFAKSEDAAKLAHQQTVSVNPTARVVVSLYGQSTSSNMAAPPAESASKSSAASSDAAMLLEVQDETAQKRESTHVEPVVSTGRASSSRRDEHEPHPLVSHSATESASTSSVASSDPAMLLEVQDETAQKRESTPHVEPVVSSGRASSSRRDEHEPHPLVSHSATESASTSSVASSDSAMLLEVQDETAQKRKSTPHVEPVVSSGRASSSRRDEHEPHPLVSHSATHVEVERLEDQNVSDMYTLLVLHLEQLGAIPLTTQPHSYDKTKDVFRFDLPIAGIERLINLEQKLFDEDEQSVLTVRALFTGKTVIFTVVDNPNNVKIAKRNLQRYFGKKSRFSAVYTITCLQQDKADLQFEDCSVASLIVSIGEHALDHKLTLKASFPSSEEPAGFSGASALQDDNSTTENGRAEARKDKVVVQTSLSAVVLKKLIKSKYQGVVTKQLGKDRYLVEYDSEEAAEKLVGKSVLKFEGKKITTRFYSQETDSGSTEEDRSDAEREVEEKHGIPQYHNVKKDIHLQRDGFQTKRQVYDREFLLKFRNHRNCSAFADVIFPPELIVSDIPSKKPSVADRRNLLSAEEEETIPSSHSPVIKTLLVSNILDFDEQTLYFWIKSALNVWPHSIQVSSNEEEAIVKVADNGKLDEKKLHNLSSSNLLLHGERLRVKQIAPATSIQVSCMTTDAGAPPDSSILEFYFSNTRYTGVTDAQSLLSVTQMADYQGLPVYVITYSNPQDVQSVIKRKSYKVGKAMFNVAEFYADLNVCGPDSLFTYKNDYGDIEEEAAKVPLLHVQSISNDVHMNTLQLFMSSRRHANGGEITSWTVHRSDPKLCSVHIVYKDPEVAERVYDSYLTDGLIFRQKNLELELEIPWLTELHDDRKVRVSGLKNDIDPEKLKFYLSALSDNAVANLFFNDSQTRAVAMFKQPLDYGRLVTLQRVVPLKDYPELKVSQENRCTDLIATGDLGKESIELPLEKLLSSELGRDVQVNAEELPGASDMWKITTEPEALSLILKAQSQIPKCESLAPYSEFLGLRVTSGVHRKTESLQNLISNLLLLHFLLNVPDGVEMLQRHLQSLGMVLSTDGTISIHPQSDKKNYRIALKNWRTLKSSIEKFIEEKLLMWSTDSLTQQIFDEVEAEVPRLVGRRPVVTDIRTGSHGGGLHNTIVIAGERKMVESVSAELLGLINKVEARIKEETNIKDITVPNILDYQIQYMQLSGFFTRVTHQHNLKTVDPDAPKQIVTMRGTPGDIDTAQKEMLALLPELTKSKVSIQCRPLFLKVFSTEFANKSIKIRLLTDKISAVWRLENKTVSVFSDSTATSRDAISCIKDVVWEAQYPSDREFDDLEKQLLRSTLWKDEKASMQQIHQPLEIVEMENSLRLAMAGLTHFKAAVLEKIPYFFDTNVRRTMPFDGISDKLLFLYKHHKELFRRLETAHDVTIIAGNNGEIMMSGTKDNIANCQRSLKKEHDAVCKDTHVIEHQAMIRHVNKDPEFLENLGLKCKCLVVPHKDDLQEAEFVQVQLPQQTSGIRFSTALPSSRATCEVRRDDITTMRCDAIVNAANEKLEHVGGLAYAVIQKGGAVIQQECSDHIRRNGQLMEGQVFTSSAGSLKCKKIIHAVGPRWRNGHSQEERTLYTCIDNCFDEAGKCKLQSIAIPPISTGIFGYPLANAVRTIVEVMHDRDKRKCSLPQKIIFVDNKDDSLQHFERELRMRYQTSIPKPAAMNIAKPLPPILAKKGNHTVNGRKITVAGRLTIEIVHGDVTASQEDSLVNSVGSKVNLNFGMVAKAIASKAGPVLQQACDAIAPIRDCEVKDTDAYNLPCKKILHCVCPGWKSAHTVKHLKTTVSHCLEKAASFNHRSIAFPALGTGNLNYPGSEVAKAMIESVVEYTEKYKNSSIRDVKIVIYHKDLTTQQSFDAELQRLAGVQQPARDLRPKGERQPIIPVETGVAVDEQEDSLKGCVMVNKTQLRVIHGDISNHRADVLVNSTDSHLNMNGQVSQALLSKAGWTIQDELIQLAQTKSNDGLWISGAGNLPANYIFHIDGATVGWPQIIGNCLSACDAYGAQSLAFPALGTGALAQPPKEMAKIILKAVARYIDNSSQSGLRRIDIVIFKNDMVKEFVSSLKHCVEQKGFLSRMRIKVSNFISSLVSGDIYGISEPEREARQVYKFQQSTDSCLMLDIYGETDELVASCKEELEKKLDKALETLHWSNKPCYEDDRDNIAKLSEDQVAKLKTAAEKLSVGLEIDQILCNIKVVGLSNDIAAMAENIAVELKFIEKKANEKKEELLVAKAIQWIYQDANGEWKKFQPSTNKALEDTYTKDRAGTYTYDAKNGKVKLTLDKMIGQDSSSRFKIQRNDISKSPDNSLKLPSLWQPPLDSYQEHVLISASPEYQTVENNFMKTLGAGGNQVVEIQRIQNPPLYMQYLILRKDAAKRLSRREDQVERTPMWHGTDEVTVKMIASGKFDRGMAGKNATVYGAGSYFATTSAYSARYAKPDAQGHKYVLQTRVLVGEWCQGNQQYRTAPYKNQSPTEQYESVVDDMNNPTIFVVFNDASAYPEYIIKFS